VNSDAPRWLAHTLLAQSLSKKRPLACRTQIATASLSLSCLPSNLVLGCTSSRIFLGTLLEKGSQTLPEFADFCNEVLALCRTAAFSNPMADVREMSKLSRVRPYSHTMLSGWLTSFFSPASFLMLSRVMFTSVVR